MELNLYDQFISKQNQICDLISRQELCEIDLNAIKKRIYIKHKERFNKKPTGKTVINDEGFEIVYNRTEKITLLTNVVKREEFRSDCILTKITPRKESLSFSKTEYKKLSDDEQKRVEMYIVREMNKPTMNVKIKGE